MQQHDYQHERYDPFRGVWSPFAGAAAAALLLSAEAAATERRTSVVVRLIRWLRRQATIKQTVSVLSALDDRTLADIGIHREQIRRVAESSVDAAASEHTSLAA